MILNIYNYTMISVLLSKRIYFLNIINKVKTLVIHVGDNLSTVKGKANF